MRRVRRRGRKAAATELKNTTDIEIAGSATPKPTPKHNWPCTLCKTRFIKRKNLQKHERRCHASAATNEGLPGERQRQQLQIDATVAATGTKLDRAIVARLIARATKLTRAGADPLLKAAELIKRRERGLAESKAEADFVSLVRRMHPDLEDEKQQSKKIRLELKLGATDIFQGTPDIRFPTARSICGIPCSWIEYKSSFGSEARDGKRHKQYLSYAKALGSGIVVYGHGYEMGLEDIEGIYRFSEAEITDWLAGQHAPTSEDDSLSEDSSSSGEDESIFEANDFTPEDDDSAISEEDVPKAFRTEKSIFEEESTCEVDSTSQEHDSTSEDKSTYEEND